MEIKKPYTRDEALKLKQMLKDLAVMKTDHPGGPVQAIEDATKELKDCLEFWVDMISAEEGIKNG